MSSYFTFGVCFVADVDSSWWGHNCEIYVEPWQRAAWALQSSRADFCIESYWEVTLWTFEWRNLWIPNSLRICYRLVDTIVANPVAQKWVRHVVGLSRAQFVCFSCLLYKLLQIFITPLPSKDVFRCFEFTTKIIYLDLGGELRKLIEDMFCNSLHIEIFLPF